MLASVAGEREQENPGIRPERPEGYLSGQPAPRPRPARERGRRAVATPHDLSDELLELLLLAWMNPRDRGTEQLLERVLEHGAAGGVGGKDAIAGWIEDESWVDRLVEELLEAGGVGCRHCVSVRCLRYFCRRPST